MSLRARIRSWRVWWLRRAFHLWFAIGGYYRLSRLYRVIFERRRLHKLAEYDTLAQLERALGMMEWRRDPARGMLDVISRPERVEHLFRAASMAGTSSLIGDCDEFAVYAAACLDRMRLRRGAPYGPIYFMTVFWIDVEGKQHGHNICSFYDTDLGEWSHIGNWFNGRAQRGFDNLDALARAIYQTGTLIGWAVCSADLKSIARMHVPPSS